MGKFKKFLKENEDTLQSIYDILEELSEEELNDFGLLLVDEFLEVDVEDTDDEDEDFFGIDDVKEMIVELSQDLYEDILDLLSPEEFDGNDYDGEWDYQETDGNEYKNRLDVYEAASGGKGDKKAYQEFLKKAIAKFGGTGTDMSSVPKDKRDELGDYIDKNWKSDDEELDEKISRIMKAKNRNKKKRKFMAKTKNQLRRGKAQRRVQARKDKPKKKRAYRANKVKIKAYKKSRGKAIKQGKHIVKIRKK